MKNNNKLLACPYIIWMVLFTIIPLGIVVYYALTDSITGQFTLSNLSGMGTYLPIFLRSIWLSLFASLICLIIGYPVAIAITFASEKWRPWLLLGIMLPFWTNLLIRTYALMMLLGSQGFANKGLETLWGGASWFRTLVGLQPLPTWEPVQLLFNNFAVVFGLVYVHLPFMVLPLYAVLERQQHDLLEAAADLGCTPFEAFWRVTFPLSLPGVAAGSLLCFIPMVGEFVIPDLLAGSGAQMIGQTLWSEFFTNKDWPVASAIAVVLLGLLLVPLLVYERLQRRHLEAN